MERRFHNQPVTLENRADNKPAIRGYCAVFYREGDPKTEYCLWDDSYGRAVERIMPGAFDRALRQSQDVAGLFNHDPNMVLGRTSSGTMVLTKDEIGLRYEIEPGNTSVSRDVQEHLRRGDVTGSSFSFTVPDGGERWTRTTDAEGRVQEIREVLDVDLYDCGPVCFPAYSGTTANVRSAGDVQEAKASREAARAADRRREAKWIEAQAEIAEREILQT